MSKIAAIATDSTALNLALAGIHVEEIRDPKAAEARCAELMQDGPEVLIIEEGLRDAFGERMREQLANHSGAPLIVYCPAFDEADSDVDAYLSSIIRPAVGFEIRLA